MNPPNDSIRPNDPALVAFLEDMGKREFGIATLEPPFWDRYDFPEVSVYRLKSGLQAAYRAGYLRGRQTPSPLAGSPGDARHGRPL